MLSGGAEPSGRTGRGRGVLRAVCTGGDQPAADCLRETNAQRQSQGLEPLASAPRLTTLDGELEIDEAAARECFPYGLAALLVCDDDREKFNWLSTEFAARMQYHCPAVQTEVKD